MTWEWRWFVVPGSALCVLPLVVLLGAAVWSNPGGRAAVVRWWIAVIVAVVLAAGSKIAFYGWGVGVRAWDLTCFSGHAVLAFGLWPVALALAIPPARRGWRHLAVLLGTAFALLIAISRVELRAHPVSEVIAGVLLGGSVALVAMRALRGQWLAPRTTGAIVVLMVLFALACGLAGRRFPMLPSERWLARAGAAWAGREAPVDRRQWRQVRLPASQTETPLSR